MENQINEEISQNEIKSEESPKILSIEYLKGYIITLAVLLGVVGLYYLIIYVILGPMGGGPPAGNGGGTHGVDPFNLWPLWAMLIVPRIFELVMCAIVFLIGVLTVMYIYRRKERNPSIILITIIGIILIIGTNLFHGWEMGIESSIGGSYEIYWDAIAVDNPFDFISNYNIIQSTLSVHAQTQPPGTVLIIFLFYLLFQSPGLIGIGLCIISAIFSVIFINGIFKRLFNKNITKYTALLFLLLPAVQVYYLANIYALVATFILGVIYFYFHTNKIVSILGSLICLFLASFTSFLFIFVIFFLFIFELLNLHSENFLKRETINKSGVIKWIKNILHSFQKLIFILLGLVGIYIAFLFLTGFNYLDSFLYASALENPDGFILFSDPVQYIVSRFQNIFDIMIFFGPILLFLCYKGIKSLKKNSTNDKKSSLKYYLVISTLLGLLILFLAGTPKKGETARICIFILPFLLIPVIEYLEKESFSNIERVKLLILVFGQAVTMQLIAFYVW